MTTDIFKPITAREYRPDIDGLRAVAVLAVLLYHLGFEVFGGGFVGVDVFFVISGYLISRNVLEDIEHGQWSFVSFYIRRLRRLFPALLATLIVSLVVGAWLLTPEHLVEHAVATQYAVLSLSNVLFWLQAGYFDTAAEFKILLHTWSLSIEEQFYLIWPATLLLFTRVFPRSWFVPLLILIGGTSLYAAEHLLSSRPEAVFYLTPFRLVEFALGALCLRLPEMKSRHEIHRELLFLIGISAIVYSVLAFDRDTRFPGLNALIPCFGAALAIYAGKARVLGLLLRNRLAVWVGLISYSLYLVHWPLLVYYKYWKILDLVIWERLLLLFASFVFACLLYRFVERPFRSWRPAPRRLKPAAFGLSCVSISLVLVFLSSTIVNQNGWHWRYDKSLQNIAAFNRETARRRTWSFVNRQNRINFSDPGINVLVIGDSHAKDFYNTMMMNKSVLVARFGDLNIKVFTSVRECKKQLNYQDCRNKYTYLFDKKELSTADVVVFSTHWWSDLIDALPDVIRRIHRISQARVVILGNTVEFSDIPTLILRKHQLGNPNDWVWNYINKEFFTVNRQLEKTLRPLGLAPQDKIGYICQDGECQVIDDGGRLLFYDSAHWTLMGARRIGRAMLRSGLYDHIILGKTAQSTFGKTQ
jgi:peptidoglycan/LPS O-acetylase OafA/YrhL